MKKLLNTLYVTTPDSYLSRQGENLLIKVGDETRFRIPVHNLENVICFSYIGASPSAMNLCTEKGIGLSFLSPNGSFYARVTGEVSGNVLLRRTQYRWADDKGEELRLAKRFIAAKIQNSRTILQRTIRDHGEIIDKIGMSVLVDQLQEIVNSVRTAKNIDSLRGLEGKAANAYFNKFDDLIINQKENFVFHSRIKHPPTDKVNSLLSFIYTLLSRDCASALESVGLDPQVGFMHTDRSGRDSLALDLMEELRPYLADRLVLSLINRKQVNENGFLNRENGTVLMKEGTKKDIILAWQNRKREEIIHPFLQEKIPIGLIPYVQSMLLARNIRGDLDDYPPFLWK
ncbi:MAG: type I-C CRISPR-associated endonuclease Cas1c [Thermoplasmataceae archaeon]